MFVRSAGAWRLTTLVTVIALGAIPSACGGDGEQTSASGAKSGPDEAGPTPSAIAARAVEKAARRLSPDGGRFSALEKREGKELSARTATYCNLEQLFWNEAAGRAVSPLIDTKRNNTFLAIVGVFDSEQAAAGAYPPLITRAQRACYRSIVRGLLVSQVGASAATSSQVRVARDGSSDALALDVRTKVHYPTETYKGKRYPARDRYTEARLGVLRRGRAVYLVSNFRWDRPPSNSLDFFKKVIAGPETSS